MMNASYSNLNENLCLQYCYFAFLKNLYLDRCLSIIYNAIIVYLIHSKKSFVICSIWEIWTSKWKTVSLESIFIHDNDASFRI